MVWPPKASSLWAGALLVASVLIGGFLLTNEEVTQPRMKFGSRQLSIEEVSSGADRQRGLSGREGITDTQGMLFTFERAGKHCFWMKDMNFSIDIIWLDEAKKIIDIEENVSPESYPKEFCPARDARYVLEVQAGLSGKAGVDVGDKLE